MQIINLPDDLIFEIVDFLDDASLAPVLSSCSFFYNFSVPCWKKRFELLNFPVENLLKILFFAGVTHKLQFVNLMQVYWIAKQWNKQHIYKDPIDGDFFDYGTFTNAFIFYCFNASTPIVAKSRRGEFLILVIYAAEEGRKQELFKKLVNLYNVTRSDCIVKSHEFLLDSKLYASQLELIRAKLHFNSIRCLRQWIELQYTLEFASNDSPLAPLLLSLLESLPEYDANLLKKSIEDQERRCIVPFLEPTQFPKASKSSSIFKPKNIEIMQWPAIEIARQVTLITQDLYFNISYEEFLLNRFTKGLRETKAVNLFNMIQFFNKISNWVATVVVMSNKEEVVKSIEKFIDITQHCLSFNDFNSVYCIVSGLQISAVFRLKELWQV